MHPELLVAGRPRLLEWRPKLLLLAELSLLLLYMFC
jgi:hypothetical protein